MSYTTYRELGTAPDTPQGYVRVVARNRAKWMQPYAVAIAAPHDVRAAANDLRGFVRNTTGSTPVFEVYDWRGNDVSDLYWRDVA
jgi:hypothetical protein